MYQGIRVPYLSQEASPRAVALSPYKSGDINYINRSMYDPFGGLELFKFIKPFVRNLDYAKIRLYAGAISVCFTTCI